MVVASGVAFSNVNRELTWYPALSLNQEQHVCFVEVHLFRDPVHMQQAEFVFAERQLRHKPENCSAIQPGPATQGRI